MFRIIAVVLFGLPIILAILFENFALPIVSGDEEKCTVARFPIGMLINQFILQLFWLTT